LELNSKKSFGYQLAESLLNTELKKRNFAVTARNYATFNYDNNGIKGVQIVNQGGNFEEEHTRNVSNPALNVAPIPTGISIIC
jgi:hypothetical protein